MRKGIFKIFIFFVLAFLSIRCDSGDIQESTEIEVDGTTCKGIVTFNNTNTWPIDYQIVIAAFGKDDYPLMSKGISKPSVGDSIVLTMEGIPEKTEEIAIALLNKSRKRVTSFHSHLISKDERRNNIIQLGSIHVDLLNYDRIQHQIFSNCTNCHGASEKAACGLFLTEGKSYDAIVNVPSTKDDQYKIVSPGLSDESFILHVLRGETEKVHYDHTNVSFNSETEDINLLKTWINNLE